MDWVQLFIVFTGLAGHVLVARRRAAGHFLWLAGNAALIWIFADKALWGDGNAL